MTAFRLTLEDFNRLEARVESLRNEYTVCKRKLDSKCQALLILSKELDQCRSERDQFKLMAEQLRERYQCLKKQMLGQRPKLGQENGTNFSLSGHESMSGILFDTREHNNSLQFEVDDLKQKLQDAWGDIKLLREQIARQRVGTTDEGINTRHFPAHERESLVKQLEELRVQYTQLERDLQQVLDEKQEQETERDAYKSKYERLNQELNYILKGDENRIVDIDALIMENKYLQDRLKQMEEEKSIAMATVSKYKSLLERRKMKSALKLGQNRSTSGGLIISPKQVHQFLENESDSVMSPQAVADIKALAGALLDTVNDKNLALCHQRKTNKILGNRVSELEKKIKTLEVAGLWNVSAVSNLEKLRAECEEVRTLIPQTSQSSEEGDHINGVQSSCSSSETNSPQHVPYSDQSTHSPKHSAYSAKDLATDSSEHKFSSSKDVTSYSEELVSPHVLFSATQTNTVSCYSNDSQTLLSPSHCDNTSPKHSSRDDVDLSNKTINNSDHKQKLHNMSTDSAKYSSGLCQSLEDDLISPGKCFDTLPVEKLANNHSNNEKNDLISTDDLDFIPQKEETCLKYEKCEEMNNPLDDAIDITQEDRENMEQLCIDPDVDDAEEKIGQLMEHMTNKMIDCANLSKAKACKGSCQSDSDNIQDNSEQDMSCDQPLLGNNESVPSREEQLDVEC